MIENSSNLVNLTTCDHKTIKYLLFLCKMATKIFVIVEIVTLLDFDLEYQALKVSKLQVARA